MSSETLHAPRSRLAEQTFTHHHAIVSLKEELDAVDWYRQRADDCSDDSLKEILLHNMREEIEHACMILEWLRRNGSDWEKQMGTYLYSEGPILEVEAAAEHSGEGKADAPAAPVPPKPYRFTIGSLKGEGGA